MLTKVKKALFSSVSRPTFQAISKVAVFSSKNYDRDWFTKVNDTIAENDKLQLDFQPEELNAKNALLTTGHGTVCPFVNDKIDADCLATLKERGVKLVALRAAGFNNIDLKKAQELRIKVVRVPAYSPYAVAEYAMALLLTVNRHIHRAYNRTREGNFSLDGLLGFDLHGKTAGIIGGGRIGFCFASICLGFGMKVLYNDLKPSEDLNRLGAKFSDLNIVFSQSDVISLHCPLTPETKHLINKKSIAKMKSNCIIINTGRGGLLNTHDCIKALKDKKLGGMGLDVYEQEENFFYKDLSGQCLDDDQLARLLTLPNVIVTSHQGFFTAEALQNICATTINNIIEYGRTGECNNEVILPKTLL